MSPDSWRTLRAVYGLGRTLASAYAVAGRRARLKKFYQPFIAVGDLIFEVGAHGGEHLRAFRDLGARVVALEPQPALFEHLSQIYGNAPDVTIHPWGVGRNEGAETLFIASSMPARSTFSSEWIAATQTGKPIIHWDKTVRVPVTTLDQLAALHGRPRLCRISGEGWEAEILAALSHAVPILAFDHHPANTRQTVACVERLEDLGRYCYNFASGENFEEHDWVDAGGIIARALHRSSRASASEVHARLLHAYR